MTTFRNIGSALTMGGVETAKAKEAREKYIVICGRHEETYGAYKEFVDETAGRLEDLWREVQRARQVVIETGALYVDAEGGLQAGWYPLQENVRTGTGADSAITAAQGSRATTWVTVGSLGSSSARGAMSSLSGPGAVAFAVTGFSALEAGQFLSVDFFRSRQRERERLESIEQATEAIERREAEMQQHRNRLESILPEISPAIDELASSAVDAKSANDSRLASISTMRSTLGAHCAKVAEALQEATSAIELAQGKREELRSISERSRDVTTAAAELQTESNRQEAAVNEETNRTTAVLNKLAAAIDTADELISNASVEGTA
jgi:hypothetical protein